MTDDRRDDRLPIGRFARLTGLSIGALRHYDDLELAGIADPEDRELIEQDLNSLPSYISRPGGRWAPAGPPISRAGGRSHRS